MYSPAASATKRVPRVASVANSDPRCTDFITAAWDARARHSGRSVSELAVPDNVGAVVIRVASRRVVSFATTFVATYTLHSSNPYPAVTGTSRVNSALFTLDTCSGDRP